MKAIWYTYIGMVFQIIRFSEEKNFKCIRGAPGLPVLLLNDSNLYLIPCLMFHSTWIRIFSFWKKAVSIITNEEEKFLCNMATV